MRHALLLAKDKFPDVKLGMTECEDVIGGAVQVAKQFRFSLKLLEVGTLYFHSGKLREFPPSIVVPGEKGHTQAHTLVS